MRRSTNSKANLAREKELYPQDWLARQKMIRFYDFFMRFHNFFISATGK
jgi:hypothetical protein